MIGGPRLWPSVSPGKTWAGAIVGALAGAVLGLMLAAWTNRLMPLFWLGLATAIVSELGDLFESALKRRFGVKDSSGLIPGHGGLMDRLDAFVAASVFAAVVAGLNSRGSVHRRRIVSMVSVAAAVRLRPCVRGEPFLRPNACRSWARRARSGAPARKSSPPRRAGSRLFRWRAGAMARRWRNARSSWRRICRARRPRGLCGLEGGLGRPRGRNRRRPGGGRGSRSARGRSGGLRHCRRARGCARPSPRSQPDARSLSPTRRRWCAPARW